MRSILLIVVLGQFNLKRIETIHLIFVGGRNSLSLLSCLIRQLCPGLELAFVAAVKSSPYIKYSQWKFVSMTWDLKYNTSWLSDEEILLEL